MQQSKANEKNEKDNVLKGTKRNKRHLFQLGLIDTVQPLFASTSSMLSTSLSDHFSDVPNFSQWNSCTELEPLLGDYDLAFRTDSFKFENVPANGRGMFSTLPGATAKLETPVK